MNLWKRGPRLGLALLLAAWGCADSTGPRTTGLNEVYLKGLFENFSPEYNFTTQPSELLGHVARITVPGHLPLKVSLGYADSLRTRGVNEYTLFRVGSVTKVFTATLILQLWEEGLVDLDAPFNQYLELDKATYPLIEDFSGVTIRHLLSHRSGLQYISSTTFFDVYGYTEPIDQMEKLRFLFTEGEPEFEPGSEYAYRNSNFTVLGQVIERVTGEAYHEVLKERISSRIGLGRTFLLDYDIPADDPAMAHGYFRTFDGTHYHGTHAFGSGALVSTARDLSVFMAALVDGDLFQDPATFQLMATPPEGGHYGFGLFVTQTPEGLAYGHGGGVFGFNTRMEYFPELGATIISTMTSHGWDFMITNWYEDLCYPIVREIRRSME